MAVIIRIGLLRGWGCFDRRKEGGDIAGEECFGVYLLLYGDCVNHDSLMNVIIIE